MRDANSVIADPADSARGERRGDDRRSDHRLRGRCALQSDQADFAGRQRRGHALRQPRPADAARPSGRNRLVYTYDSTGNRQTEKAYLGASSTTLTRSESLTVDLLDRLTQAQGSTVDHLTAIVYDAAGRRTTITDPNNVQHMGSS